MLTDHDRATLDLAATHYRYEAIRATHARERLGFSEVEFWQRVNWLTDQPFAASHPAVPRLRRLRELRRQQRTRRAS